MDGLIQHTGHVHAIVGDQARIAVATAACSSCGHAGGCGIGKLAKNRRASLVSVPAAGLRVGQQVTLALDEAQLTHAALLGYLLPAVLLLIGAMAGELVGQKVGAADTAADTVAAIGAVTGLLAGLLLTRLRAPLTPRLTQEPHHV